MAAGQSMGGGCRSKKDPRGFLVSVRENRRRPATTVAGPTLSDFGTEFGLSTLIGTQLAKSLMTCASAEKTRTHGRERTQDHRPRLFLHQPQIPIVLERRVAGQAGVISNEMPRLGDDSPALSGRFIILTTRQSFLVAKTPTCSRPNCTRNLWMCSIGP